MRRGLGYRDAVRLLGGDPPLLAALDRAGGAALSVATGGLSDTVLGVFNAQGRILRLGRGVAAGVRDRLTGAGRVARSQRLEAAHAVIVVAAYFEALGEADLPFRVEDLDLTAADQLRLSGDDGAARDLLDTLLHAALPCPAPHVSSERLADQLRQWYFEPIVVLGQPGAGKSVLTKMLAARLPDTDFLVVRVILREVPADAEVQDQIETAVRAATGERISWPELARAAAGAQLVVMLDGFDELLQATGVSHSDYLVKIADFQQREADLDRPVAVLVTSRIAVADRTRYPSGTVALRLEQFRDDQVTEWVGRWNRHNETQLRSRGLDPLPTDVARRYPGLASQPLLLLMLALYDAESNALTVAGALPLDESALYEQLLTAFAAREVAKAVPDPTGELVEAELQHLSLVAYSMINRRRQWVTEAELDTDLRALLGDARPTGRTDFRTPITRAGLALGRFFFI